MLKHITSVIAIASGKTVKLIILVYNNTSIIVNGWTLLHPIISIIWILIAGTCRFLLVPQNGGYNLSNRYEIGSRAAYFCNKGYRITGSFQRICTSNRTWTGVNPTCTSGKKKKRLKS